MMNESEQRIDRRQLLKKAGSAIGAIVTVGAVGVLCRLGLRFEYEEWAADEREREETGGYVIEDLGPDVKLIKLLGVGKYAQENAFTVSHDIRVQTLSNAVSELDKSCEVESITELTGRSGTLGLIVQVGPCK